VPVGAQAGRAQARNPRAMPLIEAEATATLFAMASIPSSAPCFLFNLPFSMGWQMLSSV